MLSPCRVPSHTRPVFSRQKKHGLWNAAQREQYPICIVSIPIADRKVMGGLCKIVEFHVCVCVVCKKLDAVQR